MYVQAFACILTLVHMRTRMQTHMYIHTHSTELTLQEPVLKSDLP